MGLLATGLFDLEKNCCIAEKPLTLFDKYSNLDVYFVSSLKEIGFLA
jgi:hypothetical protein